MIREYREGDKEFVESLGQYFNGSFNISRISENEKMLIYEKDNIIVAFVVFSKIYEVADLTYLVVHPDYRRLGIGNLLLKELIKDEEIKRIMLEVRESNTGAIEFYKNNGFIILRKIVNYYSDENAISMERQVR